MAFLIQRPLLLFHQADLLGTRNVPKGSRPQEKDEVTFPHHVVSYRKCMWDRWSTCWHCRRLSPTCVSHIFPFQAGTISPIKHQQLPFYQFRFFGSSRSVWKGEKHKAALCNTPWVWERWNCLFYPVEPLLKISWGVGEEAFECPEKEDSREIGT